MLSLLSVSIFLINICVSNFITLGIDTTFKIVPDSAKECSYQTGSCYDNLCNTLQNKTSCISYVAYIPVSAHKNLKSKYCLSNVETKNSKNLSCPQFKPFKRVDMIVFAINTNRVILSTKICASVGDCLADGCNMYNNVKDIMWVLYTGKCHFSY